MRVKVCGVRSVEEAEKLKNIKNVDYFGIVFANNSPYRVSVGVGRSIADVFHAAGKKVVGIFSNQPVEEVKSAVRSCNLDLVQLNGAENPDYCRKLGGIIWKLFSVNDDLTELAYYFQFIEYPIFEYDGTENAWQIIQKMKIPHVLSGNISIENLEKICDDNTAEIIDFGKNFESAGEKDRNSLEQGAQIIKDLNDNRK